jgi:hypothetical protein
MILFNEMRERKAEEMEDGGVKSVEKTEDWLGLEK